ncbi:glycosyltransferase [Flaviramulus sp. BrNp1-15]|uniref:glycosyltransferase n=1 Tax=Flaviramulus sp. BrNp1-15 TaxID=2916754 RepID=UPI001EE898AE|nr:glycosyltransferase [Flaviramulus sp. BrNp1-15]ULC60339.1 glycosyltransferase [Flaviramulus sp. BrNp1-15]
MKIGIIIIFHDNENDIDSNLFNNLFNIKNNTHLCLVNNGSKDDTLERLHAIKDKCETTINIVDIKKNKGKDSAIKAGARYLFNQNDLKLIGYLSWNPSVNFNKFKELIRVVEENKESMVKHNTKTLKNKQFQRAIFKNIFSIVEYFEKLIETEQNRSFQN